MRVLCVCCFYCWSVCGCSCCYFFYSVYLEGMLLGGGFFVWCLLSVYIIASYSSNVMNYGIILHFSFAPCFEKKLVVGSKLSIGPQYFGYQNIKIGYRIAHIAIYELIKFVRKLKMHPMDKWLGYTTFHISFFCSFWS